MVDGIVRKIRPRVAQLQVERCRPFGGPLLEKREKGRTPSVVLVSIFKGGMFHVEHCVDIITYVHMEITPKRNKRVGIHSPTDGVLAKDLLKRRPGHGPRNFKSKGVGGSAGPFSKSVRRGAPPVISDAGSKANPLYSRS